MARRDVWAILRRPFCKLYWNDTTCDDVETAVPFIRNNEHIHGVNAAGTDVAKLLGIDTSDRAVLSNPTATLLLNNVPLQVANAAGTAVVDLIKYDSADKLQIGSAVATPQRNSINLPIPLNGDNVDQCIFIAPYAMTISGIVEIHATAGNDAGAVTLALTKDTGTTAPGAGTSMMSGTFNLKATANTQQSATLTSTTSVLTLAAGDRIGANFTGTITTLAGVVVTLYFSPHGKGDFAVFRSEMSGIADQAFYIANRPMKVSRVDYVHSTAGSDAGSVNVQVTKDTGTNAPGAGTDLLTNNSNAGFNCKGTANTVQNGALTATVATLWLAAGDRLAVDFAGTTTALAGVVAVVTFDAIYDTLKDITITATANGDCVDQAFWSADRSYRIVDARYVNATAGTDVGSVNAQLTVDDLTDAPGAGVDVLSNNTNAGFNAKGTANTVEVGTFQSEAARYITSGNRLAVDFAGTLTTLAGVVITVTVEPA